MQAHEPGGDGPPEGAYVIRDEYDFEVRVPIERPGDLLRLCATPEGVFIRREPGYHEFYCEVTLRGPEEAVKELLDTYHNEAERFWSRLKGS